MFIGCSNLIPRNPPALHQGVAVADVDGDGQDEVLVAGQGGPNRLLKWDGQTLVDVADPLLADDGRPALALVCADLDGDGREEVYVQNQGNGTGRSPDRLLACFGRRWIDLLAQPDNFALAAGPAGHGLAVVDRLGSGRYGFVIGTPGLRLLELNARGALADLAEDAGLDAVTGVQALLAAPLLGDGPDILVGGDGGPTLLYRNLGYGSFEEIGAARGLSDPGTQPRGLALLDEDGLFSVVVGTHRGRNRLFQQRPGGGFADIAPPELAAPGAVRSVIVADFDNDGWEEILLTVQGAPNRLFAWRDERWTLVDCGDAAEPSGMNTGAAVADLDGDGQLELILAHGEQAAQPLSLFIAEPRGHHWLRVRPLTRAGAPARGAVVRLWAGGRQQMRAICGGSGHFSQMEPVAHFGLGSQRTVERVEVRWPDGSVRRLERPAADQLLSVPYPG
ncbi:CRTAC1 family protein [Oleisolibacter albus]|uniref:CRTAC1 family protein n=1 Tax=Oleisolibacter albus TaxID=2171757 RepID=UPI000DF1FC2A|nr:CRTAC1 family protein [Oleisolibacter albus]